VRSLPRSAAPPLRRNRAARARALTLAAAHAAALAQIDIKPENANLLDGTSADLQTECDAYEAKIAAMGGIELFMAGIGPDGHIAFSASPDARLSAARRRRTEAARSLLTPSPVSRSPRTQTSPAPA